MFYLDNAATTYPKPKEVYEALNYANANLSFNAGRGAYKEAKECVQVLDDLRKELSSFVETDYRNVTLLSSATEALNLIINGLDLKTGMNIYITPFEHNAIVRPLFNIKKQTGINIFILPFCKETWEPDIEKINNMFALNNPNVVFSSQISNVTGLKINYWDIFSASKKYEAINVLDAAQSFGIIDIESKNVDFVVFAGHKSMYGPFGVGGFINLTSAELKVVKSGGTGSDTLNHDMPDKYYERYEAGSPNVPAAYGLLAGVRWIKEHNIKDHENELTCYLIKGLKDFEKVHLFVPKYTDNIFGIVSFSVEGYSADEVGMILSDEFNICVRTGYHCSPFVHEFINSTNGGGTVRISLSWFNTKDDIDYFLSAVQTF